MAEDKKKSIFDKAIDALTDRDEKAAAAEAAEKAEQARRVAATEEARRKNAELTRQSLERKAAADKVAADKAAAEAKARIEQNKAAAEEQRRKFAEMQAKARATAAEAAKPRYIADYTVASGDTLSHVAQKYYGHATRDYYMLIYEANKETIGDNPNMIRSGAVLHIPELPENLKK